MESQDGRFDFVMRVFDAVRDGVVFCDSSGLILWANRWLRERLSEHSPLSGRRLDEVLPGIPMFSAAFGVECASSHRGPFVVCDQNDAWWQVSFSQVDDADGVPFGIAHLRDVTEHVQAEQALADEVLRRRILVEQSRDGIVVLDSEGKVEEANNEFARMLGYSLEEMTSLRVWDWEAVVPKERLGEMLASVDAVGDHFETQHRRKDGRLYDVEISTNGAVFGGKKYIFCVCRDISGRKREAEERERLIHSLREALDEVKLLQGIVPVCSYCHEVRDDEGYWQQVDTYISRRFGASISHGICPDCMNKLYPEYCGPDR